MNLKSADYYDNFSKIKYHHPPLIGKTLLLLIALFTNYYPPYGKFKEVGEIFYSKLNQVEFSIRYKAYTEQFLTLEIISSNYHEIEYDDSLHKPRGFFVRHNNYFDHLVSNGDTFYKGYFFGKIEFDGYALIDLYLSDFGRKCFNNKCYAYIKTAVTSILIGHSSVDYCLYVEI